MPQSIGPSPRTVPEGVCVFMHPGRQSRYMVVDDGQLVAVIALKDVPELIALKMEIEQPTTSR